MSNIKEGSSMIIGIAGLGLIGGSFARSIKSGTSHKVLGHDISAQVLDMAGLSGAIDGVMTPENISECDLLLVALAPSEAVEFVKRHAGEISHSAIVIDMCGVKRRVCDELRPIAREYGFIYVGGHPMAGIERSGFVNSRADLFNGASMILTPCFDDGIGINILERLKAFFIDVGFASVTFSTPDEHDKIIAYTSQLAHIISSAYIKSPEALKRRGFSAGSFRDMSRVARLDEKLWTELFMSNSDFLTEELEILMKNLNAYLEAMKNNNALRLEELLREGRELKALAGGN